MAVIATKELVDALWREIEHGRGLTEGPASPSFPIVPVGVTVDGRRYSTDLRNGWVGIGPRKAGDHGAR